MDIAPTILMRLRFAKITLAFGTFYIVLFSWMLWRFLQHRRFCRETGEPWQRAKPRKIISSLAYYFCCFSVMLFSFLWFSSNMIHIDVSHGNLPMLLVAFLMIMWIVKIVGGSRFFLSRKEMRDLCWNGNWPLKNMF